MAGRILNRQARDKALACLLLIIPTCQHYPELSACFELAKVTLDAGPDLEKARQACNQQRAIVKAHKEREAKIDAIAS